MSNLTTTRRAELKQLSNQLQPMAKENQSTINATLIFHYATIEGVTSQDFKTYDEWQKLGFSINKGEKAFSIWDKRKKITINLEDSLIAGEPEVIEFSPMKYLFHVKQVSKK
jgi:antirestriction protein ArdC